MTIQGSAGDKYRYLFTKIDEKPHFLIMSKCNFCPFMINDFKNGDTKCGKFCNPTSKHEHKHFLQTVYGYMQKGYGTMDMEVLTTIGIPTWCNLPNHLTKISPNDAIHTIVNGKLYSESGQNYANTVQIISDDEVMFSKEDFETLVLVPKGKKIITYGKDGRRFPATSTSSIETTPEPIKGINVCSFCGEDKENVNRDDHIGMCDGCWDKYKFSHPKRRISKINNFRLKRRESWEDKEYKMVKM